LALPGNLKLQSLPDEVATLPELAFINLKGSNPNLKLSEKLQTRLSPEGDGFYYMN
jgi:hypothetical protein